MSRVSWVLLSDKWLLPLFSNVNKICVGVDGKMFKQDFPRFVDKQWNNNWLTSVLLSDNKHTWHFELAWTGANIRELCNLEPFTKQTNGMFRHSRHCPQSSWNRAEGLTTIWLFWWKFRLHSKTPDSSHSQERCAFWAVSLFFLVSPKREKMQWFTGSWAQRLLQEELDVSRHSQPILRNLQKWRIQNIHRGVLEWSERLTKHSSASTTPTRSFENLLSFVVVESHHKILLFQRFLGNRQRECQTTTSNIFRVKQKLDGLSSIDTRAFSACPETNRKRHFQGVWQLLPPLHFFSHFPNPLFPSFVLKQSRSQTTACPCFLGAKRQDCVFICHCRWTRDVLISEKGKNDWTKQNEKICVCVCEHSNSKPTRTTVLPKRAGLPVSFANQTPQQKSRLATKGLIQQPHTQSEWLFKKFWCLWWQNRKTPIGCETHFTKVGVPSGLVIGMPRILVFCCWLEMRSVCWSIDLGNQKEKWFICSFHEWTNKPLERKVDTSFAFWGHPNWNSWTTCRNDDEVCQKGKRRNLCVLTLPGPSCLSHLNLFLGSILEDKKRWMLCGVTLHGPVICVVASSQKNLICISTRDVWPRFKIMLGTDLLVNRTPLRKPVPGRIARFLSVSAITQTRCCCLEPKHLIWTSRSQWKSLWRVQFSLILSWTDRQRFLIKHLAGKDTEEGKQTALNPFRIIWNCWFLVGQSKGSLKTRNTKVTWIVERNHQGCQINCAVFGLHKRHDPVSAFPGSERKLQCKTHSRFCDFLPQTPGREQKRSRNHNSKPSTQHHEQQNSKRPTVSCDVVLLWWNESKRRKHVEVRKPCSWWSRETCIPLFHTTFVWCFQNPPGTWQIQNRPFQQKKHSNNDLILAGGQMKYHHHKDVVYAGLPDFFEMSRQSDTNAAVSQQTRQPWLLSSLDSPAWQIHESRTSRFLSVKKIVVSVPVPRRLNSLWDLCKLCVLCEGNAKLPQLIQSQTGLLFGAGDPCQTDRNKMSVKHHHGKQTIFLAPTDFQSTSKRHPRDTPPKAWKGTWDIWMSWTFCKWNRDSASIHGSGSQLTSQWMDTRPMTWLQSLQECARASCGWSAWSLPSISGQMFWTGHFRDRPEHVKGERMSVWKHVQDVCHSPISLSQNHPFPSFSGGQDPQVALMRNQLPSRQRLCTKQRAQKPQKDAMTRQIRCASSPWTLFVSDFLLDVLGCCFHQVNQSSEKTKIVTLVKEKHLLAHSTSIRQRQVTIVLTLGRALCSETHGCCCVQANPRESFWLSCSSTLSTRQQGSATLALPSFCLQGRMSANQSPLCLDLVPMKFRRFLICREISLATLGGIVFGTKNPPIQHKDPSKGETSNDPSSTVVGDTKLSFEFVWRNELLSVHFSLPWEIESSGSFVPKTQTHKVFLVSFWFPCPTDFTRSSAARLMSFPSRSSQSCSEKSASSLRTNVSAMDRGASDSRLTFTDTTARWDFWQTRGWSWNDSPQNRTSAFVVWVSWKNDIDVSGDQQSDCFDVCPKDISRGLMVASPTSDNFLLNGGVSVHPPPRCRCFGESIVSSSPQLHHSALFLARAPGCCLSLFFSLRPEVSKRRCSSLTESRIADKSCLTCCPPHKSSHEWPTSWPPWLFRQTSEIWFGTSPTTISQQMSPEWNSQSIWFLCAVVASEHSTDKRTDFFCHDRNKQKKELQQRLFEATKNMEHWSGQAQNAHNESTTHHARFWQNVPFWKPLTPLAVLFKQACFAKSLCGRVFFPWHVMLIARPKCQSHTDQNHGPNLTRVAELNFLRQTRTAFCLCDWWNNSKNLNLTSSTTAKWFLQRNEREQRQKNSGAMFAGTASYKKIKLLIVIFWCVIKQISNCFLVQWPSSCSQMLIADARSVTRTPVIRQRQQFGSKWPVDRARVPSVCVRLFHKCDRKGSSVKHLAVVQVQRQRWDKACHWTCETVRFWQDRFAKSRKFCLRSQTDGALLDRQKHFDQLNNFKRFAKNTPWCCQQFGQSLNNETPADSTCVVCKIRGNRPIQCIAWTTPKQKLLLNWNKTWFAFNLHATLAVF